MTTNGPEPPNGFEPEPLEYPADVGLPPPVYPPPYPGYYQHHPAYPPTGTSGKAIAALITSVAGLACCGLSSIIGLVLGLVAMRETKRSGQDGYGLAVAAVVVSTLIMIGIALYILVSTLLYAGN
ncbi:MAG: DUF4190 domain-containing protein [Actinomycetia bacterium]|nr:DUF4190 domain-containing protein [Actinomycetes bacterium]MCH9701557.1 DUF4190 domain-containing protein [Actinomycetes bacterium]MCH9759346.1 DUF4190 domain-containing protein [Actinomycetes bacterium]